MSPIFVALVTDYSLYEKDLSWCKYSLEYSLHPVFRIIKCRSKYSNSWIDKLGWNFQNFLNSKKMANHTDAV